MKPLFLKYYNSLFMSYNTPDFTKTEIDISLISLRSEISDTDERANIGVRE